MGTDETPHTPPEPQWRWPQETEVQGASARASTRGLGLPDGVVDNQALRRAVIARPDDDAPRQAYAAWMSAQRHPFAQTIGAFVKAQLRVAQAFRENACADVGPLRSWRGDTAFVSTPDFRAGDALRPWFLDDLSSLISLGQIGWPQVYRGFIERVGVRAGRFLRVAEELFSLAPIRHLVLIGVPAAVDELAACPHLARIRSISLPRYRPEDDLTDDALRKLIESPHLGKLAHLRLVHQQRLTPRAYEDVVTAPTLSRLSSFEVYEPLYSWDHLDRATYDPRGRAERIIAFDTPVPAMRAKTWIAPLECAIGYVPCVHPEDHYGRDFVDIEAIVAHPLDERIMVRRGMSISGLPVSKARRNERIT